MHKEKMERKKEIRQAHRDVVDETMYIIGLEDKDWHNRDNWVIIERKETASVVSILHINLIHLYNVDQSLFEDVYWSRCDCLSKKVSYSSSPFHHTTKWYRNAMKCCLLSSPRIRSFGPDVLLLQRRTIFLFLFYWYCSLTAYAF